MQSKGFAVLKKRLIGVVTVKDGLAVQSFGYSRYLPLGRPEILVENLDRWCADEIFVQCIDRSARGLGPDLALLERISRLGLSTPLIYAGGIRNAEDGIAAVKAAADRICVDALLHDNFSEVRRLGEKLGAQAIISALPLSLEDRELNWFDYRCGSLKPLSIELLEGFKTGVLSEALVVDWKHEGYSGKFDSRLLAAFPLDSVPLIAFGGLSEVWQLRAVLESPRAVAAAVGNFLSYGEHSLQRYKQELAGIPMRPATFGRTFVS
jgi:cyclase